MGEPVKIIDLAKKMINLSGHVVVTDNRKVFNGIKNSGELDYVSCWFLIASNYIKNSTTKVAFVSTNSINQGEQRGILWEEMIKKKMEILFAQRT